jgi:hypothetical protein
MTLPESPDNIIIVSGVWQPLKRKDFPISILYRDLLILQGDDKDCPGEKSWRILHLRNYSKNCVLPTGL